MNKKYKNITRFLLNNIHDSIKNIITNVFNRIYCLWLAVQAIIVGSIENYIMRIQHVSSRTFLTP